LRIEIDKTTYKLFNAMQSFSGMMPYQQLPPQLAWSQRRTPPRFRLVRGVAVVIVNVVARRRVVRRALKDTVDVEMAGFDGVIAMCVVDVVGRIGVLT
jgi:hypothetical protein